MDYSQLSDQEINMQVAKIIYPSLEVIESKSRPPSACLVGNHPHSWVDYCNNPADAWPIIFSNLISVEPDYEYIDPSEEECFASGLWISEYFDGKNKSMRYADPSPLRAAMVVFIMMQDAKHA